MRMLPLIRAKIIPSLGAFDLPFGLYPYRISNWTSAKRGHWCSLT